MKRKIKKMIKGKREIGVGRNRTVFDLGDGKVLKVAKSKDGIKSNKREVMIYDFSPVEIQKHLGYIQKYDDKYMWLIMKKYRLNFRITDRNLRKLYNLNKKFRTYGIKPLDIIQSGVPKYKNLSLDRGGHIVVIDYGKFKFLRSKSTGEVV